MLLQGPGKDVHVARGSSYKKSVHPAHRDLYQDVRKETVGNMVSLGKDSLPFEVKNWEISNKLISSDHKTVININT